MNTLGARRTSIPRHFCAGSDRLRFCSAERLSEMDSYVHYFGLSLRTLSLSRAFSSRYPYLISHSLQWTPPSTSPSSATPTRPISSNNWPTSSKRLLSSRVSAAPPPPVKHSDVAAIQNSHSILIWEKLVLISCFRRPLPQRNLLQEVHVRQELYLWNPGPKRGDLRDELRRSLDGFAVVDSAEAWEHAWAVMGSSWNLLFVRGCG